MLIDAGISAKAFVVLAANPGPLCKASFKPLPALHPPPAIVNFATACAALDEATELFCGLTVHRCPGSDALLPGKLSAGVDGRGVRSPNGTSCGFRGGIDGLGDVGSTTRIEALDQRRPPTPIADVIQFFHRSTKRGEQAQAEYQKMYDEGIQIALRYFGE